MHYCTQIGNTMFQLSCAVDVTCQHKDNRGFDGTHNNRVANVFFALPVTDLLKQKLSGLLIQFSCFVVKTDLSDLKHEFPD